MQSANPSTKNIPFETDRYYRFAHKVIIPILIDVETSETKYHKAKNTSARAIQNEFGKAAADVFRILFKQLKRGGMNRFGHAFISSWVANHEALQAYSEWIDSDPPELTCRALKKHLVLKGYQTLAWHGGIWVTVELKKKLTEKKRARDRANQILKLKTPEEVDEHNAKFF